MTWAVSIFINGSAGCRTGRCLTVRGEIPLGAGNGKAQAAERTLV